MMPYTALGTDGKYVGVIFYAAPLASTEKEPVVLGEPGDWRRWVPLPGVPAGARIVAIKTDVADAKTVFIVRTDGILRSHKGTGIERVYP